MTAKIVNGFFVTLLASLAAFRQHSQGKSWWFSPCARQCLTADDHES
jgi:hypothetical protein